MSPLAAHRTRAAAYGLARIRFPGNHALSTAMFLSYLIPPALLFLPLSQMVRALGFGDSVWSLVVVYPSFTLPFCTWLLMGFVRTAPPDIEESAQLDGCTRRQAFVRIILPVIVPGVITAGIFAFTLTYQEFIYALTFISESANKTIAHGVTTDLIRGDVFYWGSLVAGALIGSLPVAIVYAFSLDHFIHGLTAGALVGYPGSVTAASDEVYQQFVPIDAAAQFCADKMDPDQTMKWTFDKLKDIYAKHG